MGCQIQQCFDNYWPVEIRDDWESTGRAIKEFIVGCCYCNRGQVTGKCKGNNSLVEEIKHQGVDVDWR